MQVHMQKFGSVLLGRGYIISTKHVWLYILLYLSANYIHCYKNPVQVGNDTFLHQ